MWWFLCGIVPRFLDNSIYLYQYSATWRKCYRCLYITKNNMTRKEKEQAHAVAILKEWGLVDGTKVYGNVTNVSKSGMSRNIKLTFVREDSIVDISYWAAQAIGWPYKEGYNGGIRVGGCGMNMVLHTIDSLSYAMGYGTTNQFLETERDGVKLTGLRGNY